MPSGDQTKSSQPLGLRLVAALFPHPVSSPQLIETHISWIVLTGDFAYKIKKPVRFDFLDYSSLELRRRHCERELEIGRRYAPEIYLDVVPIIADGERLTVGEANGTIVEYAVKMRQFDQACLLDRQLSAGQIAAAEMDALAAQLARYHTDAARVKSSAEDACARAIAPAMENFDYLLAHLGHAQNLDSFPLSEPRGKGQDEGAPEFSDQLANDSQQREAVERLRNWSANQSSNLREWFAARSGSGAVRDCHGDLHLSNLLRIEGRFLAFDPIEFNDRLSQIDTINEAAFLMMELHEHGFRTHSNRFINQYVEETGDYDGLRGLVYYLVSRAMVRAKLDLIRHTQTAGKQLTVLTKAGWRYMQYAQRVAAPAQPELWIMHGFSGSGKSTVAMRLVEERGLFRLRSDVLRKQLLGIAPLGKTPDDRLDEAYSSALTDRVYRRLAEVAEQVLSSGFGVIADATFLKHSQRLQFAGLAARLRVPFRIVDCAAPIAELERRLSQRGPDPSDANHDVLRHQIANHDPLTAAERKTIEPEFARIPHCRARGPESR